MARQSLLSWFAVLSQALPPLAWAVRRSRSRAHRFIVVAALLSLASDMIAREVALRGQHNLWVWNVFGPPFAALMLLALAEWQRTEVERLALRIAAPVTVLAWGLLLGTVEDPRGFGRYTGPMHALVLLAAAVWTWLRRAPMAEVPLLRADWFWACGGLALYGASTAAIEPLAAHLVGDRPDLVLRAYQLRGLAHGATYVLLAWSILCPTLAKRSTPSSSPPRSA
jgi:hypothetical protein